MKEHKVVIAKRTFPLSYSLSCLEKMEKTIPDFDSTKIDELINSTSGLLDILYLLAVQGAKLQGQKLDVDRDWFGDHLPVNFKRLFTIRLAVTETIVDGMSMEAEEEEDADREIDVVLEELKKKEEKTDSPGEKSSPTD